VSDQVQGLDPPPGGGHPGVDGPPSSVGDDALNRVAAAVRRISHTVVGQPVADAELAEAAERLSEVADRLEAAALPEKILRQFPDPDGHPQDFFPTSPMTGVASPVAPPVEVWAVVGPGGQREIRGRASFGYQYEGPPTCVHGGVIAELFDELLGLANLAANQPGMTGTLKIRYRRPTPLLAPLELASRHTRRDGRKIFTWGGIFHDGELTAEAEGIFIEVPADRMRGIVSGNAVAVEAPIINAEWRQLLAEQGPGTGPRVGAPGTGPRSSPPRS